MALYTFYCRRTDNSPGPLYASELGDDAAAMKHAKLLLKEHRSCARVEVYEDERLVGVSPAAAA